MPAPPFLFPLLWAQQVVEQKVPPTILQWLLIWGAPDLTDRRWYGGPITWVKVIGLLCLVAWVLSWVVSASRLRGLWPFRRVGLSTLFAGLGIGLVSVIVQVLNQTGRLKLGTVGRFTPAFVLGWLAIAVLFVWLESLLWSTVRRVGRKWDLAVLVGMHLALVAGLVIAYAYQVTAGAPPILDITLTAGVKMGLTYMGLVVLARVAAAVFYEVIAVRFRRLYAIAWQTWIESFRRMWAPWVVLAVFVVILAFTHWFLAPPEGQRQAELGRLYVGALMLLSSLLITVMVAILSPISLPNDIQQQTIYTVVSKPVRRIEMIWGRVLGFMALVTVLLVVFGGISLAYLERTVGGTIDQAKREAAKAASEGREQFARLKAEQAEQLETRMSARLPVKGVLTFIDSRGNPKKVGIDVGQEMAARSFVEGATPSTAIWQFGIVPSPFVEGQYLDRRIPVDRLLRPGTIEERENRLAELGDELAAVQARQKAPGLKTRDSATLSAESKRLNDEAQSLSAEIRRMRDEERGLRAQAAKDRARSAELIEQADGLHTPPIPLEMTFSVYRTTKGEELGQPVYASLIARNPRPNVAEHKDYLPIHEYYTDKRTLPSRLLVGSRGFLTIEVRCLSPNQYLGMSEDDLFLLARQGRFWDNYMRGLFGIWLQAMVLAAIGVFAGSFLSWPVALVTTLAFFVAGQAFYSFLQSIYLQLILGGGPFESLIRMVTHDNLQSELAPTVGVVVAKTLDSLVMPVLSRLVYIVPNFAALDVSNTVADGFAVTWQKVGESLLLALGYALPFSVAGYIILKNREVAA